MVMRITKETGARFTATLRVEGRVMTEWAALLERECLDLLRAGCSVNLDLRDVSYVDRAGVEALQRLSCMGAEVHCLSGSVASFLEGERVPVVRDGKRGTRRRNHRD
jgi:hypothetical protein